MFLEILQHIFLCFLHVEDTGTFRRPLSAEEEKHCFELMAKGDREAKNKLILHNMRLVAHIIKKYYASACDQDDLISIGTVGLIKAVSTFDTEKGIKFATYASRCIENEILMSFRSRKKLADTVYMGDPLETDKDGNQLTLSDIIDDGCDLDEIVDTRMQTKQLYQYIEELKEPREREILIARYGLYGTVPLTQREIARKMGISRSYVSNIAYYKCMAIAKNLGATIHFFILCIGQALIRIVHYNFNADIPQSGLLKVLKAVYEIILLALNCRKTPDSYVYRYV